MTPPKAKDGRETLQERLRRYAFGTSQATKMLAEAKTKRNQAAGDEHALYHGLEPEQTLEWEAADALDAAQAEIARLTKERNELVDALSYADLRASGGIAPLPVAEDVVESGCRTELRECPFCGGDAERLDFETVGSELGNDPNAGGSCITCRRCGASSPVHFDRKENLYSSWNDRSLLRQPEAAPEGWRPNWKWDHSVAGQPEKVWHYDRGELLLGKISLGQYSRWSDISLGRDGIDPKKPIHAWLSHASFVGGVYQYAPSAWFATAEEAKAFVEEGALKTLSDAGMLLVSPRELVSASAPTPASAVASEAEGVSLAKLAKDWRVEFFEELDSYVVCTDGDVIFLGDPNHKNPNDKELFEKIVVACRQFPFSHNAGLEEAAKKVSAKADHHYAEHNRLHRLGHYDAATRHMNNAGDYEVLAKQIRALASTLNAATGGAK